MIEFYEIIKRNIETKWMRDNSGFGTTLNIFSVGEKVRLLKGLNQT